MLGITATAIGGVLGGSGLMSYAVAGRSAQIFCPSVYRGDRSRRTLALTFDDGPSASTPELIHLLEQHSVHATFFMCGRNVRRYPAVARAVAAAGHEVGNHSDTHAMFLLRSHRSIEQEITTAQETLQRTTGMAPRLFRAPFGIRWYSQGPILKRLGLTDVMWTVIVRDWEWASERIKQVVLERAGNGAIICLHDGFQTEPSPDVTAMLDALGMAIPQLKRLGYGFETVSEMLSRMI
jgi:peptidoglycan-N-acetylglucosamine deacetylase